MSRSSSSRRRGREALARRALARVVLVVLSFLHISLAGMLLFVGIIVGWEQEPGRPLIGGLVIVASVAVFILGPRLIRRLTGRDPIVPPPGI